MEEQGLRADRRVYAALIRAFGQRGDVPSARGVFDEMRRAFSPDVANLMRCVPASPAQRLTRSPHPIASPDRALMHSCRAVLCL